MRRLSVRPPKAAVSPAGRARPQRNRLTPHRAGSSGVRSQESRLGPARFRTTHALLGPKPLTSSAIFCVSLVAGWALEAPPHNMVAAQLSAPIRSDPIRPRPPRPSRCCPRAEPGSGRKRGGASAPLSGRSGAASGSRSGISSRRGGPCAWRVCIWQVLRLICQA